MPSPEGICTFRAYWLRYSRFRKLLPLSAVTAAPVVTARGEIVPVVAVREARDARVFLLRARRLRGFGFGRRRHEVVHAHHVGVERVRQVVCLVQQGEVHGG